MNHYICLFRPIFAELYREAEWCCLIMGDVCKICGKDGWFFTTQYFTNSMLVRLTVEETTAELMATAVGFMLELLLLLFDGIILVWCCKTLVAWMAILISFKAAATDSSDWHAGGVSSDPEIKKAKSYNFVQKTPVKKMHRNGISLQTPDQPQVLTEILDWVSPSFTLQIFFLEAGA